MVQARYSFGQVLNLTIVADIAADIVILIGYISLLFRRYSMQEQSLDSHLWDQS